MFEICYMEYLAVQKSKIVPYDDRASLIFFVSSEVLQKGIREGSEACHFRNIFKNS